MHTEDRPYLCIHHGCGKRFRRKDHLTIHLNAHDGTRNYHCNFDACQSAFVTSGQLRRHEKIHLNPTPYKCTNCDESFTKKSKLREHRLSKHNIAEFCCMMEGCHKRFVSQSKLDRHSVTHKERYVCMAEGCMIILKNYIDLRRHKALFHPRSSSSIGAQKTRKRSHSLSIYDENEEYNETNCNEFIAASSDQGFTDNPSEFSPALEDIEFCQFIDSSVASLSAENKLFQVKEFPCEHPDCERSFSQKKNMMAHMKASHSEGGRFPCTYEGCDQKFGWSAVLKRHVLNIHVQGKRPRKPSQPYNMALSRMMALVDTNEVDARKKTHVVTSDGSSFNSIVADGNGSGSGSRNGDRAPAESKCKVVKDIMAYDRLVQTLSLTQNQHQQVEGNFSKLHQIGGDESENCDDNNEDLLELGFQFDTNDT